MSALRTVMLAALTLTGCAAPAPGFVVRDWSANLRELGIYPLFPPQENICAGDVFITPAPENDDEEVIDGKGFASIGNLFEHVPYGSALDLHYATRGRFPTTSASAAATETAAGGGCGAKSETHLLRQVAFPLVVRAQITSAQLGAFLPADAYAGRLAAGASAAHGASVSVTSGEAYGLPLAVGLTKFSSHLGVKKGVVSEATLEALKLARYGQPGASKTHVILTLVNEVYYARTFDVSFHRFARAAADAAVQPAVGASAPQPSASSTAVPAAEAPASSATAAAAVETAKAASVAQWSTLSTPSSPGVGVQVMSAASGDVALRATHSRPIAIGYRGVRWRVSLADGRLSPAPQEAGAANFNAGSLPSDLVPPSKPTSSGAKP